MKRILLCLLLAITATDLAQAQSFTYTGHILNPLTASGSRFIKNVSLTLHNYSFPYQVYNTVTSPTGMYSIGVNRRSGQSNSYNIKPSKGNRYGYGYNCGFCSGINTLDLIAIQNHLVGRELFTGFQAIAADVNNDRRVTTTDIIHIRKFLVGRRYSFIAEPWRFIDLGTSRTYHLNRTLSSPTSRVSSAVYTAIQNGFSLRSSATSGPATFWGIPAGDINGTRSNARLSNPSNIQLDIAAMPIFKDQTQTISVRANNFKEIMTYMTSLSWDTEAMDIHKISAPHLPDFNSDCFHIIKETGEINIVWLHPSLEGISIADGETLFEIQVSLKQPTRRISDILSISDDVTRSHAVDVDENIHGMIPTSSPETNIATGIVRVFPNPFHSTTTLQYTLTEASTVSIIIRDIQGREVARLLHPISQEAGIYQKSFDASGLPKGIYTYTLSINGIHQIGKMVLTE